jgi:mannose-6-phosphate isomerase-like protein (cupin superfamily)
MTAVSTASNRSPTTAGAAMGLVRCTRQDAARVLAHLQREPVQREVPGSAAHRYLDDCITKPWGHEIRVYDDRWIDVWQLFIDAGRGTSLHAHPRKDTYLVCVQGEGMLLTGGGDAITLREGTVLRVGPGALHASFSIVGMILLEVELPRDKFDLVRIDDRYGRTGETYEPDGASRRQPCPLLPEVSGPPAARLRRYVTGGWRFDLEMGLPARRDSHDLVAAISLDTVAVLNREPAVLTGDAVHAMASSQLFLTARRTHQQEADVVALPGSHRDRTRISGP